VSLVFSPFVSSPPLSSFLFQKGGVRMIADARTLGVMPSTAIIAPLDSFVAHDDPVNHVVFSRESGLIATADTAMRARIWRNRELALDLDLRSISDKVRPTERIRGLVFSSNSDRLYVAAGEHVASFDLTKASDEPDWVFIAPRLFAFLIVSPTSIAISKNDMLSAAFDNGSISSWDSEGRKVATIRHNASPRYLAYLPNETLIGTDSFSYSQWNPTERKPIWHRPSKERIYGMAASGDGKYVALRRLFVTTVFEVATGNQVAEYPQGRGLPLVSFGGQNNILALGSQHAINLYDPAANRTARLALDDAELISLTFNSDGSQVIAGCSDGQVRTWENTLSQPSGEADR
jgi:WD40 repeat protein